MMPYTPRRQSKKFLDGDCPPEVLAIYDNGGKTFDRYTVFYRQVIPGPRGEPWLSYRGMSEHPFSPQGFGVSAEIQAHEARAYRARVYRESAKWSSLPADVQRAVRQDCRGMTP